MATQDRTLAQPPVEKIEQELWMQHAAGLVIFEDVRDYAIKRLDSNLSAESRSAAITAIDDAVYGMMMVIDGVTGALENERHRVSLSVTAKLTDLDADEIAAEVNLAEGDGMCIGFHSWLEGEFGKQSPVEPTS